MNKEVGLEIQKLLIIKKIDTPVKATISDIVTLLYEKYDIWIEVIFEIGKFSYDITNIKTNKNFVQHYYYFNSPTEAYLEAITHVLKHLI